ncbi:hypothetical protein DCC77_02350 [Candidatus Uhrbacteria bacterium]|nr:MAG: hypothetical protein DCC77_02350 [Candidatus Uhrbacteria bacterium]
MAVDAVLDILLFFLVLLEFFLIKLSAYFAVNFIVIQMVEPLHNHFQRLLQLASCLIPVIDLLGMHLFEGFLRP